MSSKNILKRQGKKWRRCQGHPSSHIAVKDATSLPTTSSSTRHQQNLNNLQSGKNNLFVQLPFCLLHNTIVSFGLRK